ncbi:MAG: DUF1211 domain-containing protein [Lactobacillus sp.]|jgi:uncharacterized membrane protein|nr:DUF1211 domain-containing protein [Lactobacillus sp.]MCI2033305.1 DUF1211 domain-containing protein [Lactobacillus sp.]
MTKERVTAFIDAVLAIVMTILVLDLQAPAHVNLAGFWALRDQFVAYFISFFWVGTMWVGLHNNWHHVKTIRRSTPWLAVILLFFSSLFPYATKIVSDHFMSFGAQALYGIVVIAVTVSNLFLYRSVLQTARRNRWLVWDIVVKCVALGLSVVYPPTIMIVTLIAGAFWAIMSLKDIE